MVCIGRAFEKAPFDELRDRQAVRAVVLVSNRLPDCSYPERYPPIVMAIMSCHENQKNDPSAIAQVPPCDASLNTTGHYVEVPAMVRLLRTTTHQRRFRKVLQPAMPLALSGSNMCPSGVERDMQKE